ncbi:MFS transporter [Novosphingobium sp. BL-52-GroH]|uniref:MFS transporter n=1 Tax=Novosphingobium sp. BL-52-GroH TaxID=3349877 RepID=UPI00384C6459
MTFTQSATRSEEAEEMPETSPDRTASSDLPSAGWRSWLVAGLLAFCYTIAYLDRQVISLLIAPIQATLDIDDTQFGMLQGISFSLFYVAATLPLAWLADHTRRSRVMSGCVAAWSILTMMCGMAGTFWQMMLARIGIAAGESGLTPAALATLSDRFNRRQLATATSFYMLAPFIGGGFALSLGGAIYAWAETIEPGSLPILGTMAAWQVVFLIVGALGLIPALLLLLIADRPAAAHSRQGERGPGLGAVFALFGRHWQIFVLYQLAMAAVMILLASYISWLPAAIMRSKGIDEAEIGRLFGPIYLVCGAAGTLSAGMLVSRLAKQDPAGTVLRVILVSLGLVWPLASGGLLTSSLYGELAMMGAALFLISSVTSLSSLTFQYITPRHLRAQAMAVMAMVAALLGTGLGPILSGYMSDHLTGFAHPLSAALAIIGFVAVPLAFAFMAIALRYHARTRLDLRLLAHEDDA